MTDRPQFPESGDDSGMRYDDESTTGLPRWVKVVGIVVAIMALLVVIMMLVGGGGRHNPLRHVGERGSISPAKIIIGVHALPATGRG
jgi:hypothetical protein